METFTKLKKFVNNPYYKLHRQKCLRDLTDDMIDIPIIEIINTFNTLPYCFTLQSCYGHFVHNHEKDSHNLEPLHFLETTAQVEYRIAYIAFCIENSPLGIHLCETLNRITDVDPENVQFGCAEWFWEREVNSYVLQVEPDRFKYHDTAILGCKEALHIEKIRNKFFFELIELLKGQMHNEIDEQG